MRELLFAVVELLAYGVVAAGLTVVGLFAEYTSLSYLSAGNTIFAAWLILMGAVALAAGVSVGTGKVLPRIRAF